MKFKYEVKDDRDSLFDFFIGMNYIIELYVWKQSPYTSKEQEDWFRIDEKWVATNFFVKHHVKRMTRKYLREQHKPIVIESREFKL